MSSTISISIDDIKNYLIIGTDEYDVNLTSILSLWNTAVDALIEPRYLDNADYTDILKAGKTLFICGKLRDILPKDIIGRASERIEYILGDAKTVIDNRGDFQEIRTDSMWLLRPYLKDESLLTSSTEDIVSEFSFSDNGW